MGDLVHVCKPDTKEAELGEWRAEAGLVYTVRVCPTTSRKEKQKRKKTEKYNYYPTSVPIKPNIFKDQPWGKTEDP